MKKEKEKIKDKLKKEILENFRNEIYREDDALFDKSGNNISRQIENFLDHTIDRVREEEREKIKEAIATKFSQSPLLKRRNIDADNFYLDILQIVFSSE